MIILKRIYEGLTLRHYIRTPSTGQGLQLSPPAQDPPLFLGFIRFSLRIAMARSLRLLARSLSEHAGCNPTQHYKQYCLQFIFFF